MPRFVVAFLMLGLLGSALALSALLLRGYRVSRGVLGDSAFDNIERQLFRFCPTSGTVGSIHAFLEQHLGRCDPVTLVNLGSAKPSIVHIPGTRFPFAQPVALENSAAHCHFPGFGLDCLISAVLSGTVFNLRRRWQKPPLITLESGGVQINSAQLWIEWHAPATKIELRSEAEALVGLRYQFGMAFLSLQQGKFQLILTPRRVPGEVPIPINFFTSKNSSLSFEGKELISNGETILLLPSGFQNKLQPR